MKTIFLSFFSAWIFLLIAPFFLMEQAIAQQLGSLEVRAMEAPASGVDVFLDHPGRVVVIIRSSLTSLNFRSNMEIVDERNDPAEGEYRIVLNPENQILTVNAPGYQSEGIQLRGLQPNDRFYYSVEPAADPESGKISVLFSVEPADALLYINGERSTANQAVQLEPGPAQVRLEMDGYRTIEDQVEVSMENIFFSYSLEQIDLMPVRIVANPPGITVLLNGMDRGQTDPSGNLGLFLYPGRYSIDLQRSGYLSMSATITVTEEDENRFEYTLQRNSGRLALQVTPGDARVELNRQDYTGQSQAELAPGRYRLDVSRQGYEPYSETLDIVMNEDISRTVVLEPHRGSFQFSVVPGNAQVRLLGSGGELVQSWEGVNIVRELQTGSYTLQVSASGWQRQERQVVIERDQRLQLHVELEREQTTQSTPVATSGSGRDTQTTVVEVMSARGRVWMDRNLGASRAATSSTDAQAFGDLYQWGRAADGHQRRNSPTTSTLNRSNQPNHGDFILAPNSPFDWRSPQNSNLWQGVNGVNNPCPDGYRLPTQAEWNAERQSWSSNNASGAFNSPLKLPVAGGRLGSSGSLRSVGSDGDYWSGAVDGTFSRYLYFGSSNASMGSSSYRANGFSVRCLKD